MTQGYFMIRTSGAGVSGAGMGECPVYHERQRLELCAIHALNNLLQRAEVTQRRAEEICWGLSPNSVINPHRSFLGTGNYDVNVIMAALQTLDYAAVWWDKRRSLDILALNEIFGFILNIPSPISLGFLSLPITRKHWIAVRQIGGVYYNLDSKLKSPLRLGGPRELRDFLQGCISRGSCEILLVVTKDVEESRLWMNESDQTS
ncbi:josephin-2 [Dendrobates tinctorius]|uniref:josephin-2 n=1 Tax=Dendrobates tinctorius TaxID=92724 RepID=UPI003CCA522F